MRNWPNSTLGEVVEFTNGGAWKQSEYAEAGIPVVRVSDIHDETIYLDGCKFLSLSSVERYQKHVLHEGDVVIATVGSHPTQPGSVVGRMARVPTSADGAFLNQNAVRLAPVDTRMDRVYLRYLSVTRPFRDYIIAHARGSANQVRIAISALGNMPIALPPSHIQQRIGSVLSAYDALIENNTRRIKILEQMAQMIYREWFVNFRFHGQEKVTMVESEVGLIPQGWCVEPLERNLRVLETGSRPKGGVASFNEGVPSIGAESISGVGRFDYAKTKYVPIEYFHKMTKGVLQDRDVLVYKDGGQPGNFHPHVSLVGEGFPFSTMVINSHVYRLRVTDRITQDYLYYHLTSDESMSWMRLHGTGSAIPGLARKDLLRLPLVVPPKTLVQRFDRIASLLTSLILITARRTRNLRITREYLLPKLISGEVSVEQFEAEAVAQGV